MSWDEEAAPLWSAIDRLKRDRVRYVEAPVTSVDPTTSTFSVTIAGEQDGRELSGIVTDPQTLPGEGDTVRLTVAGAQPIYHPTGIPAVNPDSVANFAGLNVTADPTFQGETLAEKLARKAQVVARTQNWANPGSTTSELGMIELSIQTIPGHRYEIKADGMVPDVAGADDQTVRWFMRYTTNGSAPTITSTLLATDTTLARFDAFPWENGTAHIKGDFVETNSTPRTLRVGLSYAKPAGATSVALYVDATIQQHYFTITDLGPDPGDTGLVNYMAGGGAPSAPPTDPMLSGETIYEASWGRVFNEDGSIHVEGSNGFQGQSPYGNGNMKTFIGFPDVTADLAGATITYIKLWTYWNGWARPTGGHPAVSTHNRTSLPATPTGQFANQITTFPLVIPRLAAYWWTLPTAWHASFQSGTYRGVVLGPGPNTDDVYFGRFDGPGIPNGPKLAIGWRK